MSNTSDKAVVIPTDGSSISFIPLPEGATNMNFQVASGSANFVGTAEGFAIVPLPAEQKYGLVAVFDLPSARKLNVTLPFTLAIGKVTIFAPVGVKVRGDAFTDMGLQDFSGTSYTLFEAADVAAGTTLEATLTGKPDGSAESTGGISQATKQWLIIGLGTGGMALIGVGLFLFIRERRKALEEEDETDDDDDDDDDADEDEEKPSKRKDSRKKASAEDERDAILDAIIALDDQHKAGKISKSVYDKRRSELKDKLKGMA
jgi:hypothetical protein